MKKKTKLKKSQRLQRQHDKGQMKIQNHIIPVTLSKVTIKNPGHIDPYVMKPLLGVQCLL
jgi:hypothetical protein